MIARVKLLFDLIRHVRLFKVCSGNGKCKGSGTRKGNGKCSCNKVLIVICSLTLYKTVNVRNMGVTSAINAVEIITRASEMNQNCCVHHVTRWALFKRFSLLTPLTL